MTVTETALREKTGALILGIIRDTLTLNNPGPGEALLSHDRLVLSGTKEQLNKAILLLTHGKTTNGMDAYLHRQAPTNADK